MTFPHSELTYSQFYMEDVVTVFKALSDPIRLRILNLLLPGEQCVCDLVSILKLPQSTTSRHLAILKNSGLIHARKNGLWHYYKLNPVSEMDRDVVQFLEKYLRNDIFLEDRGAMTSGSACTIEDNSCC